MSDRQDIARVLLSEQLCVRCLREKTDLTLDRVLDGLAELETSLRVSRVWGTCPMCGERRGVLTIA
jgi:hypothetical protein